MKKKKKILPKKNHYKTLGPQAQKIEIVNFQKNSNTNENKRQRRIRKELTFGAGTGGNVQRFSSRGEDNEKAKNKEKQEKGTKNYKIAEMKSPTTTPFYIEPAHPSELPPALWGLINPNSKYGAWVKNQKMMKKKNKGEVYKGVLGGGRMKSIEKLKGEDIDHGRSQSSGNQIEIFED